MKKGNIFFYLDTRRKLQDGKYPLKIKVYHLKERVYFTTEYCFTEEQWNIVQDRSIRKHHLFDSQLHNDSAEVLQKIRDDIDYEYRKVQIKYDELVNLGIPFKAKDVKTKMSDVEYDISEFQYIYNCHIKYIERLKNKNSAPKTIVGYKTTISILKQYYENLSKRNTIEKLRFVEIDYVFLNRFEEYLSSKGNKPSTISAHNRYIRALFNFAIGKKAIPQDIYPFGKGDEQYQIKAVKNTKKALTSEELKKLIDFRSKLLPRQVRNFDLAMLSFALNGANMIDIAQLKYKNNYDSGSKKIHFFRTKTIRESQDMTEIFIPIDKTIDWFIRKYGNPNSPDNYIFNILRPTDITREQISDRVKNTTRAINKTLKRVAKQCGVREDISFQFFRHTHATYAIKEGNASPYQIMQSMGHKNIKTTAAYIASLPEDEPAFVKKKRKLLESLYEQSNS